MLMISKRLYAKLFAGIDVKLTSKGVTIRTYMKLIEPFLTSRHQNFIFDGYYAPDWGNFFDVRKGEVSYHSGQQNYTTDGQWIREGRQVCKPSKLVKYLIDILGVEINGEYFIEELPKLKARFLELVAIGAGSKDMEIKVSDDPECIYSIPTASNTGTLGTSCMRHESNFNCHNYRAFYNALGTKIAYSIDRDGKLTGRALLWDNVIPVTGDQPFKFIDRIYGSEETIQNFKEWAHENGYAHKVEQSYCNCTLIFPDGTRVTDFFHISNPDWDKGLGFPYVDTLKYLKIIGSEFKLCSVFHDSKFDLSYTDGRDVRPPVYNCHTCGIVLDSETEVVIYDYDGDHYCSQCTKYSNYYCHAIPDYLAVFSVYHNSFIFNDSRSVQVEGDWVVKADSCYTEIDGIRYFKNSPAIHKCHYCRHYFLNAEIKFFEELHHYSCPCCFDFAMTRAGYIFINGRYEMGYDCHCCGQRLTKDQMIYERLIDVHICKKCVANRMIFLGYEFDYELNDWVLPSLCEECYNRFPADRTKYYRQFGKVLCHECYQSKMAESGYSLINGHWRLSISQPISMAS